MARKEKEYNSTDFVRNWVKDLAEQKYVENLISRQLHGIIRFEHHDLAQLIYLELLRKPEEKVKQLIRDNLVENFINRMIKLQLRSNSSEFYGRYRYFSRCYSEDSLAKAESFYYQDPEY